MKKITLLLTILIGLSAWADIPEGYYYNAVGKQDEDLMTALEGIINIHSQLGYNFLWDCYPYTDAGSDGYYIDMYSTCKYNHDSYHPGNATFVGQGLNREHSFPKSWFGGEIAPMFTDLMMIIPVDAYVNQRRSNNPYGVCAGGYTYVNDSLGVSMLGKLGTSTYNGYTSTVFEPDDEYKGDFARIYFYMVTCYKSDVQNWPGCGQLDYATNGYKAFSDWSIQMLLEWHRADPVSPKEIARNEAVYSSHVGNKEYGQGNRNPFVDHPELAEYIWGTKQNTVWTGNYDPDPIDKEVPEMLPVDEAAVTGTSFRADWTAVDNVSSYTLKVSRTEESGASLVMTEGFNNLVVYTEGHDDIGASMDDYTDNPGWTGFKVYTAVNQGVKLGTSSAVGYIVSPELQLGSTVSVVVNSQSWINSHNVSDGSSIVVSCGDESQTIPLSTTPEDYTVVLYNCNANQIKLASRAAGKRLYIYNVEIYNGDLTAIPSREIVEEGDSTWRMVSGITEDNYTVRALDEGLYEYMVKAIYTDGTESVWSNIQNVILTGEGDLLIGDVNGDNEVTIADVTALINILLSHDMSQQDVSDVNGDGETNIADVTALINYLLSGSWN